MNNSKIKTKMKICPNCKQFRNSSFKKWTNLPCHGNIWKTMITMQLWRCCKPKDLLKHTERKVYGTNLKQKSINFSAVGETFATWSRKSYVSDMAYQRHKPCRTFVTWAIFMSFHRRKSGPTQHQMATSSLNLITFLLMKIFGCWTTQLWIRVIQTRLKVQKSFTKTCWQTRLKVKILNKANWILQKWKKWTL